MFFGSIAGLIAVGMIDLWLYPPPEWMKGDAWYAGGLCVWHGQVMPCPDAVQACITENRCFGPPSQ